MILFHLIVKLDTCFLPSYSLLKRTYCTCFGINWVTRTSYVRYTVSQFIILCNMFLPGQPSRAQSIWNHLNELFMKCRGVVRTVFSTLQYIMVLTPNAFTPRFFVAPTIWLRRHPHGLEKCTPSKLINLLIDETAILFTSYLLSASYYRYNYSRLCFYWELFVHLQIYDMLRIIRELVLECIHLYKVASSLSCAV